MAHIQCQELLISTGAADGFNLIQVAMSRELMEWQRFGDRQQINFNTLAGGYALSINEFWRTPRLDQHVVLL